MSISVQPVILCGGQGRRLWPVSTPARPKQFLRLGSEDCLVEQTAARLNTRNPQILKFAAPIIVGSAQHEGLLRRSFPHQRLILEPVQRNTGPAIAAACLACAPDTLLLILPADHMVQDVAALHRAIMTGAQAADAGAIVTFGIEPSCASSDYGYIQVTRRRPESANAALPVLRFVEKPDANEAEEYLLSRTYLWNAGMFLFRARTALSAFQAHAPVLLGAVRRAAEATSVPSLKLCPRLYPHAPDMSFDHAVLEHAANLKVVPAKIGWTDIGSFTTLHETVPGPADALRETVGTVTAWLRHTLEIWANRAWDHQRGGFVEQMSGSGVPDPLANRRTRVQARQVYAFSAALACGCVAAKTAQQLIADGLDYIDRRLRHPDRGWVHAFRPDGRTLDHQRHLCDHAFIILACAAAYRATRSSLAPRLAEQAMTFIDQHLRDRNCGGWLEACSQSSMRCSDSHMHLLEATLAWHRATGSTRALDLATETVALFEAHFFDPGSGAVAEYFNKDWRVLNWRQEVILRSGHLYEWASLLAIFEGVTGCSTRDIRHAMIGCADRIGRDPSSGFAFNAVYTNGTVLDSNRRLWPQLEMFRAYWLHPECPCATSPAALLQDIHDDYLRPGPDGGWIDETDAKGRPIVDAVPASVLYHLVSTLSPLISNRF